MQVALHNTSGQVIEHIDLDDTSFAEPFNETVVHQAVVRQLANARLGTASTKTRSEVSGSTRKLYRQKHTGRARRGSIKSPLLRGGGVVFGPHPRSYGQDMPKKMRRLALRCVLSAKARAGELFVLDQLRLEKPRTKDMAAILKALKAEGSTLVVTREADANVVKSARNLPRVKTLPVALLSVADLLSYKFVVMTADAVRKAEEIWGKKASSVEA